MKNFSIKSFITGVLVTTVVIVPTLTLAASTQTIEAVFGKISLIVNGTAVNQETLLYNGTTYLPIRAVGDAIGATVDYDAKTYTATLTTPTNTTTVITASNNWGNKTYLLATDDADIYAAKLVITNVTTTNFDFAFKGTDGTDVFTGTATISGNSANCVVSDIYSLSFELSGDELLITEPVKAQLFPESKATYVHRTIASPAETTEETTDPYTNFKEGKYSSGSSDSARTLIISDLVPSKSFKYQVISANGKDIVTEGVATISSEGNATCVFSEDYTITLTDLRNDVIEVKESKQTLFPAGGTKFYTI